MRARLIGCSLLLALTIAGPAAAADPPYYRALGGSLAIGIQPDADGSNYTPTDQGYVDDLYAFFRARFPTLQLAKLGCSGETTASMYSGQDSPCYSVGASQLSQALEFLQTHRVAVITIDIGADDLLQCFDLHAVQVINQGCIASALQTAPGYLAGILSQLHTAAPKALIVGMNYYDPFLAAWLFGPTGQALASVSLGLVTTFNGELASIYRLHQVPMADVASTFQRRHIAADNRSECHPGACVDLDERTAAAWSRRASERVRVPCHRVSFCQGDRGHAVVGLSAASLARYRATSTRASSTPPPYLARMSSAIDWGSLVKSRVSSNPGLTPSVARITVS